MKVTHLVSCNGHFGCAGTVIGELVKMLPSFLSALFCLDLLTLFFSLSYLYLVVSALVIKSAVMCDVLCIKVHCV